jgi:hypothetical protein
MQIAGSRCGKCDQNVGIIREGVACTSCGVVYHRVCLQERDCPTCGQSFLGGQEAHALKSSRDQIHSNRPTSVTIIGRLTYIGIPLSVVMILAGLSRTTVDVADGVAMIVSGVLMGVLSPVFASALLAGRNWARRFTLWVTPAVLAAEIVIGDNGFLQPGFIWWRSVVGLAFYGVVAFALTRPRANAFFRREARARTSQAA